MAENIKKKNFFRNLIKSIKDFEKYEDFALEGIKKSLKYIFKLIILFCIILSIVSSYLICKNLNMVYQDLKNIESRFTFKDDILTVESEDTIVIEKYQDFLGTIVIDTSGDISEEDSIKKAREYNNAIILLEDKIIVSNNNTNSIVKTKYSEITDLFKEQYQIENIEINNKEDIINQIEKINKTSFAIAVFLTFMLGDIMIYIINFLMYALILTLLAFLIARVSRMKMNFSNSFGIAVHAITLPIILNLVYSIINMFTGFEIKYFDWMYNTISYIYVIVAILMIKTDFINRQMELLKIASAQEEIEKKDKEKTEDEKPPVEDENKEKKDKEKKDGQEDSLNGSEA